MDLEAKVDSSKDAGRFIGNMDWCLLSPVHPSQILTGGGLVVLCSLPEPPVVRQFMQVVTIRPGQGGQFPSVFPLTE